MLQEKSSKLSLANEKIAKLEQECATTEKDRNKYELRMRESLKREAEIENRRAKALDEAAHKLDAERRKTEEKINLLREDSDRKLSDCILEMSKAEEKILDSIS